MLVDYDNLFSLLRISTSDIIEFMESFKYFMDLLCRFIKSHPSFSFADQLQR